MRGFRYEIWWSVAAGLLAIGAAFVPLLNVLGYESSELFCLFACLSSAAVAIRRLGDGTVVLARDGVGTSALRLMVRAWVPLLVPPVVLLLNGLRVPNCDIGTGLVLYLLLPVTSSAVVVTMVLPIAEVVHRSRWRALIYGLVLTTGVASGVAHVMTQPVVFAYHPTVGYFAGSVYDEGLSLPDGLLVFRLMSLAFVAFVLGGLSAGHRRRLGQPLAAPLVTALVAASIWSVIFVNRFEYRIESHRGDIIEALGGVARSEHFLIYYPLSDASLAGQIDAIVADHEYRYDQLAAYFGAEPELPLRSFLYASRDQKFRMMGAGRTLIAKPWLGEMHLTYDGVGDGHLTHEMAHLFSAAFGAGPLRLAGGPFSMDMGLVEGVAEAAAWDSRDLTLHGWSAAMQRLDLAPDLASLIGATGFWTGYPRTSYTLMGSFSRWLIQEQGAARYRAVYASGDFEAVYGQPVDDLVAGWRAFLALLPLEEAHLELARFRYDRPAIFAKPCARAIGALADRGWRLAGAHQYDGAVECFAEVVADDPDNLRYVLEYARMLRLATDYEAADGEVERLLADERAGRVLAAQALELRADVAWSAGRFEDAATAYAEVLEAPLSDNDRRSVTVKRVAVDDPGARAAVFALFLEAPPPPRDAATLRLADGARASDSGVLAYLMALRLYEARDFEGALAYLETALTRLPGVQGASPSDVATLIRRAELRRGQALYRLGRYVEAQRQFYRLAARAEVHLDAAAAEALDWQRRCRWAQRGGE